MCLLYKVGARRVRASVHCDWRRRQPRGLGQQIQRAPAGVVCLQVRTRHTHPWQDASTAPIDTECSKFRVFQGTARDVGALLSL